MTDDLRAEYARLREAHDDALEGWVRADAAEVNSATQWHAEAAARAALDGLVLPLLEALEKIRALSDYPGKGRTTVAALVEMRKRVNKLASEALLRRTPPADTGGG